MHVLKLNTLVSLYYDVVLTSTLMYTHGLLKSLLLTDCTANKILYRTIANLGIFVINAFILTFIK